MTLKEFMDNPSSGKKDSINNTKLLKERLDAKYESYMRNSGKKLTCKVFRALGKELYYVHLVMPTETERGNSYDVVIELSDLDGLHKMDLSIKNYNVRFFSNTPSFAFTYAKVYLDNDLLIHNLKSKFSEEQVTQNPDIRNRFGVVGYDKYLYYGVKYMLGPKILNKMVIQYQSILYRASEFVPKIRTAGQIMKQYRKAAKALKANGPAPTTPAEVIRQKVKSTVDKIQQSVHRIEPSGRITKTTAHKKSSRRILKKR